MLIARPLATTSDFTRFTRADGLSGGLDLPTQEEIRGDSQHNEDKQESENVQSKVSVKHIQFFQSRFRIFEMAVHLKTHENSATSLATDARDDQRPGCGV